MRCDVLSVWPYAFDEYRSSHRMGLEYFAYCSEAVRWSPIAACEGGYLCYLIDFSHISLDLKLQGQQALVAWSASLLFIVRGSVDRRHGLVGSFLIRVDL